MFSLYGVQLIIPSLVESWGA